MTYSVCHSVGTERRNPPQDRRRPIDQGYPQGCGWPLRDRRRCRQNRGMSLTPIPAPDRTDDPGVAALHAYLVASGGIAEYCELVAATDWRTVRKAQQAGVIVRRHRGRYALPDGDAVASPAPLDQTAFDPQVLAARRSERAALHRQKAQLLVATRSHRSAAEHYGLPVLVEPTVPEVIVPRGRELPQRAGGAILRRRSLTEDERREGVTAPLRTVLDCAADLPFAEALAAADSALRPDGDAPALVARSQLLEGVDSVARQFRGRVRRVIEAADGRAANPFESAIRALALEVPRLSVEPQVQIVVDDTGHQLDLCGRGTADRHRGRQLRLACHAQRLRCRLRPLHRTDRRRLAGAAADMARGHQNTPALTSAVLRCGRPSRRTTRPGSRSGLPALPPGRCLSCPGSPGAERATGSCVQGDRLLSSQVASPIAGMAPRGGQVIGRWSRRRAWRSLSSRRTGVGRRGGPVRRP